MILKIDFKLLLFLILGFIAATIVGTVSHEYGHAIVAECYGLDAKVHFGYTSWNRPATIPKLTHIQHFFILLGGPLQTLLTGCIGLFVLYWKRKSFQNTVALSFSQWIIIFASLFWLRFSFNLLQSIPRWIERGALRGKSDEIRLAQLLEWPSGSISLCFAIIGTIGLAVVLFWFVPKRQRFTFMVSGLIGGITGFVFWLNWIGPIVMP